MTAIKILALLVLMLAGIPAVAGETLDSAVPSTRQIIDKLTPRPAQPHFRGITIDQPQPPPSIDMKVTFEFNSATLTPEARQILDRLGEALNSPELAESRFQLAGHTDAVGGDSVNLILSERRAAAVKAYVMVRYKIAASRLETTGYGKTRLLDVAHPESAVNRRVQVTNIGR